MARRFKLPLLFLLTIVWCSVLITRTADATEQSDSKIVAICDLFRSERYQKVLLKCGKDKTYVHFKSQNIEMGALRNELSRELTHRVDTEATPERQALIQLLKDFLSNGMNFEGSASQEILLKFSPSLWQRVESSSYSQYVEDGYSYYLQDGLPTPRSFDRLGKFSIFQEEGPKSDVTFLYWEDAIGNHVEPFTIYSILIWE